MNTPWKLLSKPQYWIFAPFLGLLLLMVYLPYRVNMRIGQALGLLLYYLGGKNKQTTLTNLNLCFPSLDKRSRHQLIKKNFLSLGMSVIETGIAWLGGASQLPPFTLHGLENWQKHQKTGVLLIGAHLSCLELAGRFVQTAIPLSIIYRPPKHPLLDAFVKCYRQKYFTKVLVRSELRQVVRALRQGDNIWYAPDIDAGKKNNVFAPFFNVPASTLTTTARLAELGRATAIMVSFYRRRDLSGYDIYFSEALEGFPSGDEVGDAFRINTLLEEAICKAPEQYLWQYKRFKTRPRGEKRLYAGSTRPWYYQ
jgi:KDO2-lipid IV(A) lauroyltransferase